MPALRQLRSARGLAWLALILSVSCSESQPQPTPAGLSRLPTTTVVLPGGAEIEAELAVSPEDQARGMMFRTEVPPDTGMLFVGNRAAPRSFWMYQCLVPLDMVWLDGARRIVEIVREAPPCRADDPQRCPSYGGNANSVYVLELAAGQAVARGLQVGDQLEF